MVETIFGKGKILYVAKWLNNHPYAHYYELINHPAYEPFRIWQFRDATQGANFLSLSIVVEREPSRRQTDG
jgi:hypothetical protein